MQFLLYRSVIHYNSVCDDVIISHTNTNTNTYMLWNICGDIFVSICKLYMFCCGYMSLIFTITTAFKVTNFTMILFGVFWWYFVSHFCNVCWHISHEHINLFFFLSFIHFTHNPYNWPSSDNDTVPSRREAPPYTVFISIL